MASGTTNYTYDKNGNLLTDDQKALTIVYNLLNLPVSVTKTGDPTPINFIYTADGTKLRKVSSLGARDYIGGIEYSNGSMDFVTTEEGRAIKSTNFVFEYYLKDHLGNTRVTVKDDGSVNQLQDYYAFGMDIDNGYSSPTSPPNIYKYNGKEQDNELGLNMYDYGARFYDPVIGRWGTIDRLAEDPTQIDLTPYNYVGNNPISKSDPDGNCPNCLTALIGAGIGGLIGGGAEAIRQLYHSGHITSWRAVGGAAVQGGIVGGAAGFTGGASLLVTAGTTAGANIVGGVANRAIQGRGTTAKDVAVDGAVGAVAGVGGYYLQKGLSALASKGSVWALGASERGFAIEAQLGGNLPYGFPVIDKFENGVATSIKSIDVTAESYMKGNGLFNTLKGYVNKLGAFQGGTRGGVSIDADDITSKVLDVAIQPGKATTAQWEQLSNAMKYAKDNNVQLNLKFVK
ncbi:MAG: RHS repeat-associated core domain-containing protein [Mucilaginibacter sp.]